jgi:hypothetical protein
MATTNCKLRGYTLRKGTQHTLQHALLELVLLPREVRGAAAAHFALFLSLLKARRTCELRFIFCTAAL